MLAEIVIDTLAVLACVITLLIVGSIAAGLAVAVWDEYRTQREWSRSRKHWREQERNTRAARRARRIARLEQELGIDDNRRNT